MCINTLEHERERTRERYASIRTAIVGVVWSLLATSPFMKKESARGAQRQLTGFLGRLAQIGQPPKPPLTFTEGQLRFYYGSNWVNYKHLLSQSEEEV